MSLNGKRRKWSAEDKLRIVLEGMQPGVEVSDLRTRDRGRDREHDHTEVAGVGLPQRRLGLVDQRAGRSAIGRRLDHGAVDALHQVLGDH